MRTLILVALASLLAVGTVPVEATHGENIEAPYLGGLGATVDTVQNPVNGAPYITAGYVFCDVAGVFATAGLPCLGGTIAVSAHGEGENPDWSQGYTQAEATGQDGVFGNQVGLWVCLPAEEDTGSCNNNNDVLIRSCGLGTVSANTADYVNQGREGETAQPGFKTLLAAMFIDTLFVDPTTNDVCTASTGSINVLFS